MKAAHYPGKPPRIPVTPRPQRLIGALAAVVLALLLNACGGDRPLARTTPAPGTGVSAPRLPDPALRDHAAAANAVLMRALGLVGTPYRYGGNTPEGGFDCSGLVTYVYRDMLDLRLPRSSGELAQVQGPRIDPGKLAPADLVFFGQKGKVSHVGIYVGEGRFVHAPSTGGTVRLDALAGAYWRDHYTGAKRVLR